jgi:hypothetical protein
MLPIFASFGNHFDIENVPTRTNRFLTVGGTDLAWQTQIVNCIFKANEIT